MTSRDRRELTGARIDEVVRDLRNQRAAGVHLDGEAIAAAIEQLPERQRDVMSLARQHIQAGRRRPNLSAIARELRVSRATVQEAYDTARLNMGIALT